MLLLFVLGCDPTTRVAGTLAIDPALAPAAGSKLRVVAGERREPIATWDPRGLRADVTDYTAVAGQLAYPYAVEEIGGFGHALYLTGFVDLDDDGMLETGEPFGNFAGNPIIDADDGTIADISITMRAP